MKDGRVLKTQFGQYERAQFTGKNESGYQPVNDRIVVLVDAPMEVTKGGIMIAQDIAEKQALVATHGVIVATGPTAFTWNADRSAKWEGDKPAPGTRILFQKYSGEFITGLDEKSYRVMDSGCVGAIEVGA